MLRDMVVSRLLGTSHAADALYIAYRIPNLLRRLTAEGAVSAAFIPVFTSELDSRGKSSAVRVANTCFTLATFSLTLVVILGVIFSREVLGLYALGFRVTEGKIDLAVLLNRIMFPYMVLISISALGMGVLNSMQIFAPSAAGPILLNLSIIACAYGFSPYLQEPAIGVAVGVVLGGLCQVLIQLPALHKNGFHFRLDWDWRQPAIRRMGRLLLPGLFGIGITQINVFIDSAFGSLVGEGAVSALYLSDRVMEFIMGVYTLALATAILPTISRLARQEDWKEFSRTFFFGMRLMAFLTIPATLGLILLRFPIIRVLFERGRFDHNSTSLTALPLLCFSIGLGAFSGLKIVTPAFYARQDTRTPVFSALLALLINFVANWLLLKPMGAGGPALATSIAAYVNFFTLYMLLRSHLSRTDEKHFLLSLGKFLLASVPLAAILYLSAGSSFWVSSPLLLRIPALGCLVAGGALLYFALAFLLRCPEIGELRHLLPHRRVKP